MAVNQYGMEIGSGNPGKMAKKMGFKGKKKIKKSKGKK